MVLNVQTTNRTLILIIVHINPNADYKQKDTDQIFSLLDDMKQRYKSYACCIIGDFNYDFTKAENHQIYQKF